jgi:hypothetical protein
VDDKFSFFEQCQKFGLPTVDVLGVFMGGTVEHWYGSSADELPECDLIFKPTDTACGRGVERWNYDAQKVTWNRGKCEYDRRAFLDYCCRTAQSKRYILQPRALNHPSLVALAPKGLCTARIVTYRRPDGESGILFSCLRMPTGGESVDNFAAGGIAAPLNLETGILGHAVAKDPTRGTFERHPDSAAPILGRAVPFTREAVELVMQAHDHFNWIPFIGWDVVITEEGPVLLEANPQWCFELTQIVLGKPLGETVYPEVFLEHLTAQQSNHLQQSCRRKIAAEDRSVVATT